MKKVLLFCGCLVLLSPSGFARSACDSNVCPEPDARNPSVRVTSSELESLIAAGRVVVINARPGAPTGLPGSKSLAPNPTIEEVAELIASKDFPVVTYCGSINCHLSGNLAKHLRSMGYTNVREYPPGIRGWKRSGRLTVAL